MDRIRVLRREEKISQRDLGSMLGRTRNSVSQWELGKQVPGVVDIGHMCRIFRVSADYLLGLSDDRQEPDWISNPDLGKMRANLLRLRELRIERHITQQELAAEIGRACSTISVWEREKQTPGVTDIGELCHIFGVSADYLLGLSELRYVNGVPPLPEDEPEEPEVLAAHLPSEMNYSMLNPEGQELMSQFFEVALKLFPADPPMLNEEGD